MSLTPKRKRKISLVAGTVVAVMVAAAIGFLMPAPDDPVRPAWCPNWTPYMTVQAQGSPTSAVTVHQETRNVVVTGDLVATINATMESVGCDASGTLLVTNDMPNIDMELCTLRLTVGEKRIQCLETGRFNFTVSPGDQVTYTIRVRGTWLDWTKAGQSYRLATLALVTSGHDQMWTVFGVQNRAMPP